jgi:hypothetical protein
LIDAHHLTVPEAGRVRQPGWSSSKERQRRASVETILREFSGDGHRGLSVIETR